VAVVLSEEAVVYSLALQPEQQVLEVDLEA
jgi:hypothetical protein